MAASAGNNRFQERTQRARRHNHALVTLARRVWDDTCTLSSAVAQICRTAAETLDVARVNVWHVDLQRGELHCIHAYERDGDRFDPPGYDDVVLKLDSEYGELLDDIRVIDIADVGSDPVSLSDQGLRTYLERNDIQSLLDAPIRSEGVLLGVVCHEHVGSARVWTPEDQAFAGSIGDYIAVAYEITRRREIENRLRFLERHDPHTNLPNRDHLLEVAHAALRPLHDADVGLVVVHLQLDVPAVDAAARTDAYQEALAAAAVRLQTLIGESSTIARVREDAFAVIPHRHLPEIEALELAERCMDVLQAGDGEEGEFPLRVSTGIAFSRDLAAPSADTLLRNAENASLRARDHGVNRCEVFDADRHRGLLARLRTEQALREAFSGNHLMLHYMPEIDPRDGRWLAAEALLRWRDDDGRIVPAGEFIDVAEACGLIVRLGRWVLLEACRTAMQWPQRDGHAPMLRVNVSARQFEQAGLVADVSAALDASGLPPERLCLELTETLVLRDPESAARTLARLRGLGVRIALDDFGSGYCSLSYLKHLPIDVIKIDRGFTAGLPDDRADLAIVQAVTQLAGQLDIGIVAEGVETEAQAACLMGCGVHAVQGWLYSPAIDSESLVARFGGRI